MLVVVHLLYKSFAFISARQYSCPILFHQRNLRDAFVLIACAVDELAMFFIRVQNISISIHYPRLTLVDFFLRCTVEDRQSKLVQLKDHRCNQLYIALSYSSP